MPPKHASVAEPAWLRTRAVRGVEADWGFEGIWGCALWTVKINKWGLSGGG